jgi:F-type H+-transporting ATPase subunit alpha
MQDEQTLLPEFEHAFTGIDVALQRHEARLSLTEAGVVTYAGEGIVRVKGLPNASSEELIRFSGGVSGMVFNLDESEIGVVLLDDMTGLEAGSAAYRTGRVLDVPVGESLLGRVVDALGRPLDDHRPIHTTERRLAERDSPRILDRGPVKVPLQTGIKCIDALFPIGRGQRQLILGDRQTGKTAIAIDTILNQKNQNVVCVYCVIGKQNASVAKIVDDLQKFGAMEYTIVVVASADAPVGQQFIAAYSATSMAEFFMMQGRDVLIVYDDLTWHARAYRELSLLLRRPPGREAYPGDIFFIHSRLLERSTQLREEHGGGSLTALPIIETQAQNIAAYIPTNIISITDGQLFLSPSLFQKGILPAIDVGRSVSRVGGKAQLPAYRDVGGKLRLAYAQFQELEAFARFSTRLDEASRLTINRGRRVREVLKQAQYDPRTVAEQIAVLLSVTEGLFDTLSVKRIADAESAIYRHISEILPRLSKTIAAAKPLSEDQRKELLDAARESIESFAGEARHAGS